MRYFLRLAYNGHAYHGWQRQPSSTTVQQTIEETVSLILGERIELVGCGRTDAGVHASAYAAHVDTSAKLPVQFVRRLNRMLPKDIVVMSWEDIGPTPPAGEHGVHARFSATHRAYRYDITRLKDPFRQNTTWHYPLFDELDIDAMNAASALLMEYSEFAPFCKSNSDAKTMRCDLRRSEWVACPELVEGKAGTQEAELHYHIAADRFLRGMVRLIVGACIRVGSGQLSVEDLKHCMETQTRLPRPLSVPPDGLFLTEVHYE
ncbi:MAG: tRNA pseudouridine(38-40) synthase TruA [Saprospiraceae bacterium]